MKIIAALKELRILEKKMHKTAEDIQQYASKPSNEISPFGTDAEQQKEVAKLVQAGEDIESRMRELKRKIDLTNLKVTTKISGKEYTLTDILFIRRKTKSLMRLIYDSLNNNNADSRIARLNMRTSKDEKTVTAIPMYDEKTKREKQRAWQDLNDEIESRLETINATEDLVE